MNDVIRISLEMLKGFSVTLEIFFITLIAAIPLGLIIYFGSASKFKPLSLTVRTFVWIVRGTPLMLQLIAIYYGPGLIFENAELLPRFTAVLIAFIINYACYFSEIYRGGIESIPKGQYEAGQVLGMTRSQIFRKVILLQVIKRIVPPMGNEIITLVKDTSLSRVIAVYEIIYTSQRFIKNEGLIWPLFYTAVFYLAFSGLLTLLLGYIEKKMSYFKSV
jgi:polar amino acid transport system permease protein